MKTNIGYFLTRSANKYPEKTALVIKDQRFTFSHLNIRANKLAHGLMNIDGKKGDKFAILMFNCHQFIEVYYAVMKIGGVFVSLNGRLIGNELRYIINHSDVRFLIFFQIINEVMILMVLTRLKAKTHSISLIHIKIPMEIVM